MNNSQEQNRNNSIVPQGYLTLNNLFPYQEQPPVNQNRMTALHLAVNLHNNQFANLINNYRLMTLEIVLALIRNGGRPEGEVNNQDQEDTLGDLEEQENTDPVNELLGEVNNQDQEDTLGDVVEQENTDPVNELLGEVNNQDHENTPLFPQTIGDVVEQENNVNVGCCTIL